MSVERKEGIGVSETKGVTVGTMDGKLGSGLEVIAGSAVGS